MSEQERVADGTTAEESRSRTRVLIIDDRQLLAEALALVLGSDPSIAVINGLGDRPDVILTDFFILTHGSQLGPARAMHPEARLLVLVQRQDRETVLACVRAGAGGCVSKAAPPSALIDAIKRVHRGEAVYPTQALIDEILEERSERPPSPPPTAPILAPRELDVLRAFAAGMSAEEVAAHLSVSVHTVRTHTRSILAKLEARSRLEAVLTAIRLGLIEIPR
jgi:DNA-binding NarL/FixJ family response regulator